MAANRYTSVTPGGPENVQRLEERWNQLIATVPMLRGETIKDIVLGADEDTIRVAHRLGRRYTSYMVVGQNYNGVEHDTTSWLLSSLGGQSYNHSLGGAPTRHQLLAECVVSQGSWSVGDFLDIDMQADGTGNVGFTCRVEPASGADTVYVRKGSGGLILFNTTGGTFTATTTSWRIHLHIWRERRVREVRDATNPDYTKYIYLQGTGFTADDKVDILVW